MATPRPRTHLPIPDHQHVGVTTYDAKDPDTGFPKIESLRPPEGAPNIVLVLLDDVGFGASSAFGGPCDTPIAERLAAGGLKYNRFHTTALCAPTRQALLTGRNHHSVGMGAVPDLATSAPGYSSIRPKAAAPFAETLKLNGYSTAHVGKCHEVPMWETSPMGPFDQWPTGSGFEYFYGFIGGGTNQWYPGLYEGTNPVEPTRTPEEGYHLTEDLADHAIGWMRQQKTLVPDKPFFLYFAPGATHAPHHAPKAWIDRYRGRFDAGWDALRQTIFARQKELGVIPADADLTDRPEEIPAWDDVPDRMKPVLARQMEVFAGFLSHADHQVGRLIDTLEELEILDDTLVLYLIGDNGASAEGTPNGTVNELLVFNQSMDLETPEILGVAHRRFRQSGRQQPLRGGVGPRHLHSVSVDETGGLALRWHAQRDGDPLAERLHLPGRAAVPVPPCRGHRPHHSRGCRPPGAALRSRDSADAVPWDCHELHLRRPRGGRPS